MAFSHHRIGFPMISCRFSFSIFGRPLNLANVPKICHPSLGCLRLPNFMLVSCAVFLVSQPGFSKHPNLLQNPYFVGFIALHLVASNLSGCTVITHFWRPDALTPAQPWRHPAMPQVAILQTVNACQVLLHKLDSSQARVKDPWDEKRSLHLRTQRAWVVYNVTKSLGDIYIYTIRWINVDYLNIHTLQCLGLQPFLHLFFRRALCRRWTLRRRADVVGLAVGFLIDDFSTRQVSVDNLLNHITGGWRSPREPDVVISCSYGQFNILTGKSSFLSSINVYIYICT